MTLRDGVMISALGGLAAGTWWLTWTAQDEPVLEAKERFAPDFFMDGARILVLNSDGHPKGTLLAQSLVHYADDDLLPDISTKQVLFDTGTSKMYVT